MTPTLSLPEANFAASGADASRDFTLNLSEVGGQPITSGTILITLTAPVGYTLSFDNTLTSINESGGSSNPVTVDNTNWQVSSNLAGQQLMVTINAGQLVGSSSQRILGFTITRTTANAGSVSSITVNVADDAGHTYDVNSSNNVYARIISGL